MLQPPFRFTILIALLTVSIVTLDDTFTNQKVNGLPISQQDSLANPSLMLRQQSKLSQYIKSSQNERQSIVKQSDTLEGQSLQDTGKNSAQQKSSNNVITDNDNIVIELDQPHKFQTVTLSSSSIFGFDLSNFGAPSVQQTVYPGSSVSIPTSIPSPSVRTTTNLKTQPAAPSPTTNTQTLKYQQISNTFFSDIILYHEIPQQFIKGQHYFFKGKTTRQVSRVNVILSGTNGRKKLSASFDLLTGDRQFEIPFLMSDVGDYYITIFVGTSGNAARTIYKIVQSSVLPSRFTVWSPPALNSVIVYEKGNQVFAIWKNTNGARYPISKLTFKQQIPGVSPVQFIITNFVNQFKLPFSAFAEFKRGLVSIAVQQAESTSGSWAGLISEFSTPQIKFFNAREHCFAQYGSQLALTDKLPYIVKPNTSIRLSGRTLTPLKNEIVILDPSNNFNSVLINPLLDFSAQISQGQSINIAIDFNQSGIYVLEVNKVTGQAVINRPVYGGDNIIPLLPDFQDLKDPLVSPAQIAGRQPQVLSSQRQLLLNLINEKRREFGFKPIVLDDKLSVLAQKHSDDMVSRNYISHSNLEGQSSSDRAKAMGIYEEIGENIGVNSDLKHAHLRLCRSNIHLQNILYEQWERVGLGVKYNPRTSSFVVVQEFSGRDFSAFPPTSAELSVLQSQILSYLLRQQIFLVRQNSMISQKLKIWHNNNKNASSSVINNYLSTMGLGAYSASKVGVSYNSQSLQLIKNQPYIMAASQKYDEVALSVVYSNGMLEVYVGYVKA